VTSSSVIYRRTPLGRWDIAVRCEPPLVSDRFQSRDLGHWAFHLASSAALSKTIPVYLYWDQIKVTLQPAIWYSSGQTKTTSIDAFSRLLLIATVSVMTTWHSTHLSSLGIDRVTAIARSSDRKWNVLRRRAQCRSIDRSLIDIGILCSSSMTRKDRKSDYKLPTGERTTERSSRRLPSSRPDVRPTIRRVTTRYSRPNDVNCE